MTTCTKRYSDIPFAHRQPAHEGHCKTIHGHNWSFEFEFVAREKDKCGFVVDFGRLQALKHWLGLFDHALVLNEDDVLVIEHKKWGTAGPLHAIFVTTGDNLVIVKDCSCEGLAELALSEGQKIIHGLTDGRVAVKRVTVYEDSKNTATAYATAG